MILIFGVIMVKEFIKNKGISAGLTGIRVIND